MSKDEFTTFLKGACQRGIYDNMKTAVDAVFVGKDRQFNRRFLQLLSHHLVEPTACTPAAGWEKGQVENQVGTMRERFIALVCADKLAMVSLLFEALWRGSGVLRSMDFRTAPLPSEA